MGADGDGDRGGDRDATDSPSLFVGLWRGGRGPILLSVSTGWLLAIGIRITYPVLLPDMVAEYQLDYAFGGLILSAMWVAYALMQFPGGVLADSIGEGRILTLSLAITAFSIVIVMVAPTLGIFLLATVCIGIGTGLYGTTRVTILSDVYTQYDSTAISISQAAGNLGNAVLPVVAGLAGAALGWRLGIGILLPLFLGVIVGMVAFVPGRTSSRGEAVGQSRLDRISRVARVIGGRTVLVSGVLLCLLLFLYQGVTGFLPTYLIEAKGISSALAAGLFGFFFVAAIVCQFVSGVIADTYGTRIAIALFSFLAVPAYLLFPVVAGPVGIALVLVGLALALGAIPPTHTYTIRLIPEEIQGSAYGLVRTGYLGFGALAPPIIGLLLDIGRFELAFPMLGLVAMGSGVVALSLYLWH